MGGKWISFNYYITYMWHDTIQLIINVELFDALVSFELEVIWGEAVSNMAALME